MSEYEITARDSAAHAVFVGYDPAYKTFTFRVCDQVVADQNRTVEGLMLGHEAGSQEWNRLSNMLEEGVNLCQRGTTFFEITSAKVLATLVKPYADIPPEVMAHLGADQMEATSGMGSDRDAAEALELAHELAANPSIAILRSPKTVRLLRSLAAVRMTEAANG